MAGRENGKGKLIFGLVMSVLFCAMIAVIAVLAINLKDERATTKEVDKSVYMSGAISETGERIGADTSIVTADGVKTEGLMVEVEKEAKLTYRIFFYAEDGALIASTTELASDFNGENIPEGATLARVVVTATGDEDKKLTLTEALELTEQIHVIVNK